MSSQSVFVTGFLACCILAGLPLSANAAKIEFLVAELPDTEDPHGDSYVLTIDQSQTALIEHARALIAWVDAGANPETSPGSIVVIDIAAGADGFNRDVLAPGEPLWSWHQTSDPSFVDFTAEVLDGWPTFIEQDVEGWIDNTNGALGFWGYTVVAELGPAIPEPSTAVISLVGFAAAVVGKRPSQLARKPKTQLH